MYKVAFIGSGLASRIHLKNLKDLSSKITLSGCINPHFENYEKERLIIYKKLFGKIFTDIDKLLNLEKPDIVLLCTPPFARFQYEKMLISKGINYLVEKPPLFRRQEDLIELLNKHNNSTISIGYQWRYLEFNNYLSRKIKEDKISHINIRRFTTLPFVPWKYNNRKSCGTIYERLMHAIDYCEYLFKDYVEPISYSSNLPLISKNIEGESSLPDAEILVFRINNILGNISTVSCCQDNDVDEISLVGEKNIYKIVSKSNGTIKLDILINNKIVETFIDSSKELYKRELLDFLYALKNKENSISKREEYLKAINTSQRVLKKINNINN